jgi:putative tryptophan/tyrosine transport system substrate-binding protein
MKRRDFIGLLTLGSIWPFSAGAQQTTAKTTIGFLHGSTAEGQAYILPAFKRGLSDAGFVEGQNLTVEYRWADGRYDRLPAMAAELVAQPVAAILAVTPVAALAAKRATTSIPIVFVLGSDPVKDGLVKSLNRPEGNITGATFFSNLLVQKRLELLHELVPKVTVVALLLNPRNANAGLEKLQTEAAAQSLGLQLVILDATTEGEIEEAFAKLDQKHATAVVVSGDAQFSSSREQIANLAIHAGVATSFTTRAQVEAGGLMCYGASILETVRQGGDYIGRILKGAKPGDLPVQEPTKFDFIINMKTAKLLGLDIPSSMQMLATDVIE